MKRISFNMVAAVLAIAAGALVLAGWALDLAALKSVMPGWVAMMPNTAAAFILTGLGLLLFSHPPSSLNPQLSTVLSLLSGRLAGLIGLASLIEYATGWDLGLDQCFFHETAGAAATSHPGRMAPDTALCFVLLAVALETARACRRMKGAGLALAALGTLVLAAALVEIASCFAPSLRTYGWGGWTMMAPPTAGLLAALAVALARLAGPPPCRVSGPQYPAPAPLP